MEKAILKYALANAIKFEGKANPGAVIGKIISEFKLDPKEAAKEVNKIIKEVNKLSLEEQQKQLEELGGLEEKEHKKKEGLKDLPFAEHGKVVLRFAPSPSGPLHIGHAYVASLNYEYKKKYNGKFIIRIEDTNPENITMAAYDMIPEDADWLCEGGVDQIIMQSDRMDIYYNYMEKLLKSGSAYVCDCDNEEFKKNLQKAIPCVCRNLDHNAQIKRFRNMFDKDNGYQMGEVVIRFKSNINHPNPAMRDFPLMRINDSPHPRVGTKYRVWPLMNFSVAVDDLELGVTHALRGKDHADNAKRQEMIHHSLNAKTPFPISVGRINFEGFEVSCTKTKEKIEQGLYSGWDDIRIPFLQALKRRGYHPRAFRKYAVDVGITKVDKSVNIDEIFKSINAHNSELVDPIAYRYFFIDNPKLIRIKDAPEQSIELDLHPDNKKGGRLFKTNDEFYITEDDYRSIKSGELIRLMDCLNFRKKASTFVFDSKEYEKYKAEGKKIIHWLPKSDGLVDVEILMPDNTKIKGLAEPAIRNMKENEVCQLERFGFVRLDKKEKDSLKFWFCH
jgi:glutamyl-tRNA synthetase